MKASLFLAYVAATTVSIDAHGILILPQTIPASGDPTRYASEVRGTTVLTPPAGGGFNGSPSYNLDSFTKAFKSSTFKSLRELIEQKTPTGKTCGITPPGGPPQDLPDHLEWTAFADSHVGPCEAWCGEKRVFQNDNCAGAYPERPAKMQYNRADCVGSKELRFYWLALHSQDWQIYVNCAVLKGDGTGGGGSSNNSTTMAPAPTPNNGGNNNNRTPTPAAPSVSPTPVPNNNGSNNSPTPAPNAGGSSTPPSNGNGGNTKHHPNKRPHNGGKGTNNNGQGEVGGESCHRRK